MGALIALVVGFGLITFAGIPHISEINPASQSIVNFASTKFGKGLLLIAPFLTLLFAEVLYKLKQSLHFDRAVRSSTYLHQVIF